jgi:hypothetical protein
LKASNTPRRLPCTEANTGGESGQCQQGEPINRRQEMILLVNNWFGCYYSMRATPAPARAARASRQERDLEHRKYKLTCFMPPCRQRRGVPGRSLRKASYAKRTCRGTAEHSTAWHTHGIWAGGTRAPQLVIAEDVCYLGLCADRASHWSDLEGAQAHHTKTNPCNAWRSNNTRAHATSTQHPGSPAWKQPLETVNLHTP